MNTLYYNSFNIVGIVYACTAVASKYNLIDISDLCIHHGYMYKCLLLNQECHIQTSLGFMIGPKFILSNHAW